MSGLTRWKRAGLVALALALYLLIEIADTLTGFEASLSLYYLLPLSLVCWYGPRWLAFVLAVSSARPWWLLPLPGATDYERLFSLWNSLMEMGMYVAVVVILTALRRTLERERATARTDVLTGIPNARAFREAAEVEIARARRGTLPLSLAFVDLDRFKEVNDRLGHQAGDVLLRDIAEAMKAQLRATDLLARLGGDEFVVLLPGTGLDAARTALERLRAAVLRDLSARGSPVTLSMGAATFLRAPASVDDLIGRSDALMYRVKSGAKDGLAQEEVS